MGRGMAAEGEGTTGSLQSKPGVLFIGRPNVGKRTLLSRLLSVNIPEVSNLSSGIHCLEWTLQTKYYSAELFLWITHLDNNLSLQRLLPSHELQALVMVFDTSDEYSFLALKDWVSGIDIRKFQILLCIGNKADLVSGHYAHAEYRRRLQKHGESGLDLHPEFWDYGINETESFSLLGNDDPSNDIKKSCMEWCVEHNIEYIEACASNADFDKCLSVDGDIQGVERLFGALAAHMWPGMILKSGNMVNFPAIVENEDFTDDDESDYEIEYEVLSGGANEPWDNTDDLGSSCDHMIQSTNEGDDGDQIHVNENGDKSLVKTKAYSTSSSHEGEHESGEEVAREDRKHEENTEHWQASTSEVGEREFADPGAFDEDLQFSSDELERLMGEIGTMRGSLRLMPDFQRREMAAKLALKMAAMFGDSSDEDGV